MKQSSYNDVSGQKFGRLIVLEKTEQRQNRRVIWKCLCDCGNLTFLSSNALISGNTTSCGCYNKDIISLPINVASLRRILKNYKNNAFKRNIVFGISESRFYDLIIMDCYYCGCPPSRMEKEGKNGNTLYNGIDRLDSEHGYIEGNVVPCCKTCNFAKNKMSYDDFKGWIGRISDHMLSKEILRSTLIRT